MIKKRRALGARMTSSSTVHIDAWAYKMSSCSPGPDPTSFPGSSPTGPPWQERETNTQWSPSLHLFVCHLLKFSRHVTSPNQGLFLSRHGDRVEEDPENEVRPDHLPCFERMHSWNSPSFSILLNKPLITGSLPYVSKEADIVLIHKKGSKTRW